MKLIITVNTWEEEVREAIIHTIDNHMTIIEFKVYAATIAKAIARNDIEKATELLWTYSETGYKKEHIQEIINKLRDTYEREK